MSSAYRSARRTLIPGFLGSVVAVLVAVHAAAQTTPTPAPFPAPPAGEAVLTEPHYRVSDLTATVSTRRELRGSFTLTNLSDAVIGDVRYKIQLLGRLPSNLPKNTLVDDAGPLYIQLVDPAALVLLPRTFAKESFTLTLPDTIPAGPYRLRIRTLSSKGREGPWQDAPIALPGNPELPFARMEWGTIDIPGNTQLQIFRSGPTAPPNTDIGLRYTLTNPQPVSVTGTPELTVHEFALTRPVVATLRGDPVTIAPGESHAGIFRLQTSAIPEAYEGHLRLVDERGFIRSTDAEYRFVVQGESAEVVDARFSELGQTPGSPSVITTTVVGSADGETAVNGTVEIALLNGGRVLDLASFPVTLNRGTVTLDARSARGPRPLTTPGLRVVIRNTAGVTLDAYSYGIDTRTGMPTAPVEQRGGVQEPGRVALGLFLVLLLVGTLLMLHRRRQKRLRRDSGPTPATTLMILFALGASTLFIWGALRTTEAREGLYITCHGGGSTANRCQDPGDARVNINGPTHQSTINNPRLVRLEFDGSFNSNCENSDEDGLWQVEWLSSGGKKGPYDLTSTGGPSCLYPAGDTWTFASELFYRLSGGSASYNKVMNLDLSDPSPGASTTVRVFAWRTDPPPANACIRAVRHSNNGVYEAEAYEHGYLWLNIDPKPDLIVESLSPTGSNTIIEGESVSFSGIVKNISSVFAGPTRTRLRLDINNDNSWDQTFRTNETDPLGPDGTETETWPDAWTALVGTSGWHTFEICANDNNNIDEGIGGGNNCATEMFRVLQKPDLTVPSSTLSISLGAPRPGNAITFRGYEKNAQNQTSQILRYTVPANSHVARFCREGTVALCEAGTTTSGTDKTVTTELRPNVQSARLTSDPWTATPGNHRFYLCADATKNIGEESEVNNCSYKDFTVRVPSSNAPIAVANISDRQTWQSDEEPDNYPRDVVATRDAESTIYLWADKGRRDDDVFGGSQDPDGWTHRTKGVSEDPGECAWDTDDDGLYDDFVQPHPESPRACNFTIPLPPTVGERTFRLRVTDQTRLVSNVSTVTLRIEDPAVRCAPATQSVQAGQPATITASGGDGLQYAWTTSPPGCTPTEQSGPSLGLTTTCQPAGTYSVAVTGSGQWFTNALEKNTASCAVTAAPATIPPPPRPLLPFPDFREQRP